jgi:hypothetical protein
LERHPALLHQSARDPMVGAGSADDAAETDHLEAWRMVARAASVA